MRVTTRAAIALIGVLALAGCSAGSSAPRSSETDATVVPAQAAVTSSEVIEQIQYGVADTVPLMLDVCVPIDEATTPRAAVIVIHGGSWARGDKADPEVRDACVRLADQGFVAFSINYRLAPAAVFPAQLDDVQSAVTWLRAPEQSERFGIDPDRIGLLGASAGGHLAALAASIGAGDLTVEARVAAVVDLSGPTDLRAAIPTGPGYTLDFAQAQLDFLGCTAFLGCATSTVASPVAAIDPTDPPFFIGHALDEFIPISQAEELVNELGRQGVDTTYVPVAGSAHGMDLLDGAMMVRVVEFFDATLG